MEIKKEKEYIADAALKFRAKTIIDGVCLEDAVDGYKTLNIQGRGILGRKAKIVGADSAAPYITNNKFRYRELEIDYMLKAADNSKYLRRCELLNYYLNTNGEDVEIYFTDDKYTYKGQVTEIKPLKEISNWEIGKFVITCIDTKKYGKEIKIKDVQRFDYDYRYPIIPEVIKLTCTQTANIMKLINDTNGQHITLHGDFKAGDVVEIYPQRQEVIKGKENALKYINITSNLEDFKLRFRDVILSNNCNVDMTIKEQTI